MSLTKAQRDKIHEWKQRGYSVDQTARLMKLPEPLIIAVLRAPKPQTKPEFTPPPAFDL